MARKTAIWPKCEVCGEIATTAVVDRQEGPPKYGADRDGVMRHWQTWEPLGQHWYCKAHNRPATVRQLTDQERAQHMARNEGLVPVA